MKIFISHPIKDEYLATMLKTILEQEDEIEIAYIAQKIKKYELEISNKIIDQINDSDCLVAIITKNSISSASVNQELGYAQGKNIPKIPLIEKDAVQGVLIYGKDVEEFQRETFEDTCKQVRDYLLDNKNMILKNEQNKNKESSESFLSTRNLLNLQDEYFALNSNSRKLHQRIVGPISAFRPLVLFSACPCHIYDDLVKAASPKLSEWINSINSIILDDKTTQFRIGSKEKITMDSISYHYFVSDPKEHTKYVEFNQNGFLEEGITYPLIREDNVEGKEYIFLHLCWVTGIFWQFLEVCRKYYEFLKFDEPIDVFLPIRKSDAMTLFGFGGKVSENTTWVEPYDRNWHIEDPKTDMSNIQLKIEKIKPSNLTKL